MWTIMVKSDQNPFADQAVHVDDYPFLIAEWASKANPDKDVTISSCTRVRARYRNGQKVYDNPDLRQFFRNISD